MNGNDIVAAFRRSLERLFDEVSAFHTSQGGEPKPGSIAAQERASYSRPDAIQTVLGITNLLLESVGEHVTTFVKTITEPVNPLAAWTCVRSMLESSAIAAWLLDPAINAQTRVGRVFAHRYEGMEQQLKLMNAMGTPAADIQKFEAHINDTENIAFSLGFARLRNNRGQITSIGQPMPNATEMIQLMLQEGIAYRLMSAVAHGHTWALQQVGFKAAGPTVFGQNGVVVTPYEKHSGTVQGYAFLATRAAKCFAVPLWNHCRYFGWNDIKLKETFESVYDEFQGSISIRFWR